MDPDAHCLKGAKNDPVPVRLTVRIRKRIYVLGKAKIKVTLAFTAGHSRFRELKLQLDLGDCTIYSIFSREIVGEVRTVRTAYTKDITV